MAINEMVVSRLRLGFPAIKQTIEGKPIVFFRVSALKSDALSSLCAKASVLFFH